MIARSQGEGASSPYVAFKNDRERRRALVSRDIRWVLVAAILAVAEVPASKWQAIWQFVSSG